MKQLFLLMSLICITSIQAQDASDAMRYSIDNMNGTARFRAMGGAFGALGGDFSSIAINPAGSAVFITNQASITASNFNIKNKSDFFGTKSNMNDTALDLTQIGALWIFDNGKEDAKWKKISLAFDFESTNNFNNSIYSTGINPTNSISNYFNYYANGLPANIANGNYQFLDYGEQQAYLGLNGSIIRPVAGTTTNEYESDLTATGNFYQENAIKTTGFNGKLSINTATSFKDILFLGLNINLHSIDFTKSTSFYEDYNGSPNQDPSTGVQALRFTNDLYTYGAGFSFQLGAIAKLNDLRAGLSYESPTWFTLNDELLQTLAVDCPDCATQNPFYVDPNITIVYPTYNLRTPGKINGSLAYVFGRKGLLSIDYTYKDYTNSKFRSGASDVNAEIKNTFTAASEIRIGGEYRIKQWSLRGGYRFQESPYKNGKTIGDLNSYSTGLGYNFGDFKVDLSYTLAKREYEQAFFSRGLTDAAQINSTNNNVSVTVLFEL